MGSGGKGHYGKVGRKNHQSQQAAKSVEGCRSRVRPGERGSPGAEQNRAKGSWLLSQNLPEARPEGLARQEEVASERSKGVMRPASPLEWSAEPDGHRCVLSCGARDWRVHALISLGRSRQEDVAGLCK